MGRFEKKLAQVAKQQGSEVAAALKRSREKLLADIGPRYSACSFASYDDSQHPGQAKAKARVMAYAANLGKHAAEGRGLILFGSSGTGKDHLTAATAAVAQIHYGIPVAYTNGGQLHRQFRRAMKKEAEAELVAKLCGPPILWLSDPVAPGANLTDFQAGCLFAVIDERYRNQKPTWVTCNVMTAQQADELLTTPVADRLRDGAVAIHFNWPSWRAAADD
jgi:DNA replication protein DnaC